MTFSAEAHTWLAQAIGTAPDDFDIAPLRGAMSSSMFVIRPSSRAQRFVLRVLDNRDWLQEEPDLAAHEAAALQEAQRTGVPAPQLIAFAARDAGFGAPVVLMSLLAGAVQLRPTNFDQWLDALAAPLAVLHRHTAADFAWRYRSWIQRETLATPLWTAEPRIWEQALEIARGKEPDFRPVFIHRDFHPANILWRGHQVSGVVDWINACQGPAGVDVAHCRSNLALMFGAQAADRFLEFYSRHARGYAHHSYWDINSILDMGLPEPEFYRPWGEFGLGVIVPQRLQQRLDDYLRCVVQRA